MKWVLPLLLIGCLENTFLKLGSGDRDPDIKVPTDTEDLVEPDDQDTDEPSAEPGEPGDAPDEPSQEPDSEPSWEPSSEAGAGSSQTDPTYPYPGEVIINELMIDPTSVPDKEGEWIEVLNVTAYWMDLYGLYLMDAGVDEFMVEEVEYGSMIVAPGGMLLICANADFWSNGGVDCHGVFNHQTFGNGFGLSNSEDEVALVSPTGTLIDMMAYAAGFAIAGTAKGLDPREASESENDDLNNWCAQNGFMPQGDHGSPGDANSWCF